MVAVSYNNLQKLLIDKGMDKTELKEASGISFNVMARMGKNETVSLESLEKICMVLNCNIGDIMDITTKKEQRILTSAMFPTTAKRVAGTLYLRIPMVFLCPTAAQCILSMLR